MNISVSIDLGSDTCKVAFAYKDGKEIRLGKLVDISTALPKPFLSIASYDSKTGEWHYAYDAIMQGNFDNIVNIKELLSLLKDENDKESFKLFNSSKYFPIFTFSGEDKKRVFKKMISKNETRFLANKTPEEVCMGYFIYISKKVDECINVLSKDLNKEITYDLTLIYPTIYGKKYGELYSKMVSLAFNKNISLKLDSTRSSCFLAYAHGLLSSKSKKSKVLVFDIGKEQTSVVKAGLVIDKNGDEAVAVEGMDGHNSPISVGGADVDNAILEDLTARINSRAAFGKNETLTEEMTVAERFVFANAIRNLKTAISRHEEENVSEIGIPGEVVFNEEYGSKDLKKTLGIASSDGDFAYTLASYILQEIKRDNNKNVDKIFLTGGTIETFGLFNYLEEKILDEYPKFKNKIFTFEVKTEDTLLKKFRIKTTDDATYSSSLGGAIAKLNNYSMKTVLSLSYGTYLNINGERALYFYDGAQRGSIINEAGGKYYAGTPFQIHPNSGQFIVAIDLTEQEANENYLSEKVKYVKTKSSGNHLVLTGAEYKKAVKYLGMRFVAGGINSSNQTKGKSYKVYRKSLDKLVPLEKTIINGKEEFIVEVVCEEWLSIDSFGRVTPCVRCVEARTRFNIQGNYKYLSGIIRKEDIVIEYNNINKFDVEQFI